ncbi:CCHC-type domain-containing protein [Trichonephila clavipes]|nr:CCHC-type domain-containing protein [Trichonephila clavipes]
MPTEQEAKPAVVTPSLQQWRSPSTFRRSAYLKWLKEYDRVANFNKWDDMMCLANVYFFLDGTARQWYVNNEDALDSWEAFKNGLSGLFGDRQKYTRRAEEQLKMPSPAFRREYTVLHTKCIRTLPREEVHRLVNQTQESLDSDPQSLEEIVQDEVERVLAPVSTKPTETRPRPTYAAVTRKYRAPVQKFPPEPRKTDVWRTADNRPVCFHCGRPGHVMRYCRERKAVFDNSKPPTELSTTLALKKKYADQTLLAVLRQVPREADPQYVVTDPRRHIADPVSRQAVGARKTKESDLPRSRFWGIVFVISDKYRRFLKKVLFADAKSVMLKVADGNFVRPIGKCVLRDGTFLEASQAVIDCGQNELVLEDICRDSTAPDAWNLYATRDYTLKPHSLTRITVSGYQTRGDINSSRRQQTFALREKILLHRPWYPHIVTEK